MTDGDDSDDSDAYDGVTDGDGCAEIWEKLSRRRRKERLAED